MPLLFEGHGPALVAAVCAVYLAAYFVKGAFGFGQLTPAILASALLLQPHHAVLLTSATSAVAQTQFISTGWRQGDHALARPMIISNIVGATVGIWIFGRIDASALSIVLGVGLGLIVAADMFGILDRLVRMVDLRSFALVHGLSFIAGVLTGVTGAGGVFLMAIYLKAATPDARSFRATALLITAVIVAYCTVVLALGGYFTVALILETAVLLPFIFAGAWLGARLFGRLDDRLFFRLLNLLVLVCATLVPLKSLLE